MADPVPENKDIKFSHSFAETAKNGLRSKNATLQLKIMDFFLECLMIKQLQQTRYSRKFKKR